MSAIPTALPVNVVTLWNRRASTVLAAPSASVSFTGLSDKVYRVSGSMIPSAASIITQLRLNNDGTTNVTGMMVAMLGASWSAPAQTTPAMHLVPTGSGPAAADYPMTFSAIIQKPAFSQEALGTYMLAAMGNTGANQQFIEGGWLWPDLNSYITRIDVFTNAINAKVGSHFTVEGML